MKSKLALIVAGVLAAFATSAMAQVRVGGYSRSNGSYVTPHYRSYPDGDPTNNWSTYPNINPYTGERGRRSPWPYAAGGGAVVGLGYALRRQMFKF